MVKPRIEVSQGDYFIQSNIPMSIHTEYNNREPVRDYWRLGGNGHYADDFSREETCDDFGVYEIRVHEIIDTQQSGKLVVYYRRWIDPEGEEISRPRREISSIQSLRSLLHRRNMLRNQGPFRYEE